VTSLVYYNRKEVSQITIKEKSFPNNNLEGDHEEYGYGRWRGGWCVE
jgi:hypothetical protein